MDTKRIFEVISIIKKSKYKAYLVGGSSRDLLFGRDFNDIDIATNAPISFLEKTFKVEDDTAKNMGSIKINYKNLIMEITRFRKETYDNKSIYPKIEKYLEVAEEDAIRRDFTINAIYIDITNNEIIDPYDGIKDLFGFKIRFIGDPKIRIKEDPTRILRGIRLAYKMNFEIEQETKQAMVDNKQELSRLSKNKYEKLINKMIEEFGERKVEMILETYQLGKESYEHK